MGQGSAFAVILGANSNVPVIDVGKNASISASVSTDTVSPTASHRYRDRALQPGGGSH